MTCQMQEKPRAVSSAVGGTSSGVQRKMAGVEIGLRIAELQSKSDTETQITSPASAILFCRNQFGRLARERKEEEFWIVTLSTRNQSIVTKSPSLVKRP